MKGRRPVAGFVRVRRSRLIVATFSVHEADILRSLAAQLVELLHNESAVAKPTGDPLEALLDFSGPTTEPDDPVLRRLFPSAYQDDAEAAGEFRRFTEGTLRDGKARAAATVIDGLEESGLPDDPAALGEEEITLDIELDEEAAMAWMRCFTDLRLALGTRLGVEEGDDDYWAELSEEDPRLQAHHIYEWLGFLQETLVQSVTD